ncbi:MAG: TonB-dependent receptor, partial [Pseudomonadota bacterium]
MGNSLRERLLATSLLAATLGVAPALAQEPERVSESEVEDEAAVQERIIVTGSRITNANIASSSPVTTVGSELFDLRGTTDTVDLVNTLPQAIVGANSQTSNFANGANGTSNLDLRGLGATRTLVLANGKRLPPGSPLPGGFASDLNLIPAPLVERVEIVTGGASAVYGSDAIAGVANFILRRDFEGVEIDGQFGFNQFNNSNDALQQALIDFGEDPVSGSDIDNQTYDISAIVGSNLDNGRGNVTAYFRYLRNQGIDQADRDFSRCALVGSADGNDFCGGSNQGPFPTSFVLNPVAQLDAMGNPVMQQLFDANGAAILDDDGMPTFRTVNVALTNAAGVALFDPIAFEDEDGNQLFDAMGNPIFAEVGGGSFSLNADNTLSSGLNNAFNFNPQNPIQRQTERFNAGFSGFYEITENVEAYADFGFTQSSSPQVIAPSAAFGSSINVVNCDNPLLTPENLATLCGVQDANGQFARDTDGDGLVQSEIRRRFVEGGGRTDDRTLTNFRFVGGLRGNVLEHVEWDIFGQVASTTLDRLQTNQVTFTNLGQALDIVDDGNGNPVCRVVADGTNPGCIPFVSAFVVGGDVDPGLAAFVDTPTLTTGRTEQIVFGGTVQTDLGKWGIVSPFAEDGPNFLFGAEYREDRIFSQADGTNQSGGLVGAGAAVLPADGETELYEIFFETRVPLVQNKPFAEEIGFTGAYRRSEYQSFDVLNDIEGGDLGVNTFSLGLTWQPVSDVRFRGQFQRAIRAPNVFELFNPVNTNLTSLSDPCSGFAGSATPPTAPLSQCANTGVTAAQFGAIPPDSGQLNVVTGGNIDLTPEEADTFTIGAVIQPSVLPDLVISVDYYNIDLEDAISTIPAAFTLTQCLETGAAQFCDLINRGPDGSLTFVPRNQAAITATNINTGGFATSGIDFQIQYGYDFGRFGGVSLNYNSTFQIENEQTPVTDGSTFDCVGFFDDSCGNPIFDYRHNFQVLYDAPYNLRASLLWRYFSSVDRISSIDPDTGEVTSFSEDGMEGFSSATLGSEHYIDAALFWDATENVELRFGVNNLFDNDPPLLPTFGPSPTANVEANTVAGLYPAGGRFIFVGARL